MGNIAILNEITIDQIAAGEVVERPLNVVKELVENAIDAKATSIHVEIKDGGVASIRITDNGSGIPTEQVELAFCRHATSKIVSVEDLLSVRSLGFRGEALSSIAAVSRLTCITKTTEELTATCCELEGGILQGTSQIGAPTGTTMIIKDLFFNTPVRRKFLKSAKVEVSYITELMEHLALSKPQIAFQYTVNNKVRFYTTGNGDYKEVIYRIYGMQLTKELLPVSHEQDGIVITGFLGKPTLTKQNRSYEHYFINGRYLKSDVIARAIELGYQSYLMQHRFPFTMLYITVDPSMIDINIHPSKMEVRFIEEEQFQTCVVEMIRQGLAEKELIPEVSLLTPQELRNEEREFQREEQKFAKKIPEPFEVQRREDVVEEARERYETQITQGSIRKQEEVRNRELQEKSAVQEDVIKEETVQESIIQGRIGVLESQEKKIIQNTYEKQDEVEIRKIEIDTTQYESTQLDMFAPEFLTKEAKEEYKILGQIFKTYWMIAFEDKLYFMDQHAAHEKVKYERILKQLQRSQMDSQNLVIPLVVTLTPVEEEIYLLNEEIFVKMGFLIEHFGGKEYAMRAVPMELYGEQAENIFNELLKHLIESKITLLSSAVLEKCASIACKAAVKGNQRMPVEQVKLLLDELLTLENPYNCPHGRPTIISMSQYEIEKKFKRIV